MPWSRTSVWWSTGGSVLGLSFTGPHLAALCEDVPDLDHTVGALIRAQILSRESSPWSGDFGQYRFVQSVVRQVAYSMLARRDRRTIHLLVIDRLAADGASAEVAPVIAQHLLDAAAAMPGADDVPLLEERALRHLRAAAIRANALGSHREAVGHLRTAIDLTTDEHLRACLQTECAQAMADAADWDGLDRLATGAAATFDRLGDAVWAGRATAAHGALLTLHEADLAGAREMVEPRWEALKDRDDADQALLTLGPIMAYLLLSAGEYELGVLERVAVVAERNGDLPVLVRMMNGISIHFQNTGAHVPAAALLEAAYTTAREHHLPMPQIRCGVNIAALEPSRDLPRATQFLNEASDVARDISNSLMQGICDVNDLEVKFLAGQWTEIDAGMFDSPSAFDPSNAPVYEAIGRFIDLVRGPDATPLRIDREADDRLLDDRAILGWRQYAKALQLMSDGNHASAAECASRGVAVFYETTGGGDDFVLVWMETFLLAFRHGSDDDLARVHGLIDGASGHHHLATGLEGHRSWARALLAQRAGVSHDEALGLLRQAVDCYRAWGSLLYQRRAEADLASLLLELDQREEAAGLLVEVRAFFGEIGAATWLTDLPEHSLVVSAGERSGDSRRT